MVHLLREANNKYFIKLIEYGLGCIIINESLDTQKYFSMCAYPMVSKYTTTNLGGFSTAGTPALIIAKMV
ncbi:MAG TPA: hypothetical protein DIW48_00350 [Sphaerochaeta sp.]|nr:hypothetical protein [Sphaerochaeta sp.]